MILETQQNWFHNFWTPTKFYIDFASLFLKLINNYFGKLKGPVLGSTRGHALGLLARRVPVTRQLRQADKRWPRRRRACMRPSGSRWPTQTSSVRPRRGGTKPAQSCRRERPNAAGASGSARSSWQADSAHPSPQARCTFCRKNPSLFPIRSEIHKHYSF